MNTAWFPGWEVTLDGEPVSAGPGTPSGLITFQIPAGEHFLQVRYGRTVPEKIAAAVSIAALIVAIVLARTGITGRRQSAAARTTAVLQPS